MALEDLLPEPLAQASPLLFVTALVVGVFWAAHVLLIARHRDLGSERLFPRQLILFGLTLGGLAAIALSLPVSDTARGLIIGLLGLMASGVIAASSSTIFANLMPGIMLRVTRPFHTGNFITVGPHFGRVVERGLLDTEIQTENRDLVALPNTVLNSQPVTVVRSSGAIVSATPSLGYDVHHATVEAQLLKAAKACALSEPFVRVLDLGNFAVTYRVSGLLEQTKGLLTARSDLNRHVLDAQHGQGIEIMSSSFMNQRPLEPGARIVPPAAAPEAVSKDAEAARAEAVVFDRADDAAQAKTEASREVLLDRIQNHEHRLESVEGDERRRLHDQLEKDEATLASQIPNHRSHDQAAAFRD